MIGTAINTGAIIAGSLIGIFIGARLPEKMRNTVLNGLGLVTSVVGIQMALETKNLLIVLGALLTGAILGEIMKISDALDRLGCFLQSVMAKGEGNTFSEGFVTASLIFCVGPMAILGSIQDGLTGNYQLLAVKSTLDGFASIAFSASLGWGVAFSALSILLFQGSITLFAGVFEKVLTEPMIVEMSATGGVIILGIGLKLLNLKDIRLANLLPALVIAPVIVRYLPAIKTLFG
jgi:uncharacterized protein